MATKWISRQEAARRMRWDVKRVSRRKNLFRYRTVEGRSGHEYLFDAASVDRQAERFGVRHEWLSIEQIRERVVAQW